MISVLFVDSYPQAMAGQQETLTALLKGCSDHGIDPTVAMPAQGEFAEALRAAGYPVEILQQPDRIGAYGGAVYRYGLSGRLHMAGQVGGYVWRLRKWMKSRRFAAVYVNDMRALLTFGLAARSLGVPVLIWDKLDKPHGLYDALQLPLASRNLMIARSVAAKYPAWQRRVWRGKMAVARNGVDLLRFRPADRTEARARLSLGLGRDAIVLGIIGTICARKGHDRLLAAFRAARSVLPDLALLVIGSPEAETAEFADRLRGQADENVLWLGARSDVAEILPALDFLVSPSRHEGMGRVNVEAMACGLPVIGAAGTGIAEVVEDGVTGLLVDAADIAALSDAILGLARRPDLRQRMGEAGLRRAHDLFDADRQTAHVLLQLGAIAIPPT